VPQKKRSRARRSIDWAAIEADYGANAAVRVLAERHGASPGTIWRRARKEGWTRDDTEPAASQHAATSPARSAADCSPDELAHLRALAVKLRRRLERVIDGEAPGDALAGARESPAALLLKLCQITEKIIAIERGLAGARAPTNTRISKEDHDILDRFKRRYRVG
jgi:hypothetical protein